MEKEWAKDVPCRNIIIHGFCKYEGKGCSFKHDTASSQNPNSVSTNDLTNSVKAMNIDNSNTITPKDSSSLPTLAAPETRSKFNAASASSFKPSTFTQQATIGSTPDLAPSKAISKFSALSPSFKDIPAFVPSSALSDSLAVDSQQPTTHNLSSFNPSKPSFNPDSPAFQPSANTGVRVLTSPQLTNPYIQTSAAESVNPYSAPASTDNIDRFSHNDYVYQQPSAYQLQYHLYAPTPPSHLQVRLTGNAQTVESLFIPNKLRETLQKRNESILKTLPQSNLPEVVGVYYSLVPLDSSLEKSTRTYGHQNSTYKVFSNNNGFAYTLRRIENVKQINERSIPLINKWIKFHNANVAQVVDAFTSRSFGDNSLIVVYDYYPNSRTLLETHFQSAFKKPEPITQDLLWDYMIQITNALTKIHENSLVARSLSLNKIIVTSKNRIRLSDVGIFDILHYDENSTPEAVSKLQQEDLTKFGKVMLLLASAKLSATTKSGTQEELINSLDSDDEFKSALRYLLDESKERSIGGFHPFIASHALGQVDFFENKSDYLETQLMKELENARLFRLLTKLDLTIDRPEYSLNPAWSEAGIYYPIKLFREYLFNQVDEKGKPVLDLSWILRTLNKLDAGIEEKFLLVSHDEQTCIIVTFKDLKNLIQKAFRELK